MIKLLRKLVGSQPSATAPIREGAKPGSATSEILSKAARARAQPTAAKPNFSLDVDAAGVEQEFDPYNTGAFNRSASWERISKRNP